MIIKPKEIEVPEEEPFANDALEREESAEVLTEFVSSTNDPLVVCIDASWGEGKTTFLRMWRQRLKNSGIHTIYFNAWENDFSDDAMVSLIGEISTSLSELDKADKSEIEAKLDYLKDIVVTLAKRSIPVLIKILTGVTLDTDKITEQALAEFAESFAKEKIEQYENSKNLIQEFRDALRAFAASISAEDRKPLVFIIDELDRCRPNYAIEVLEKAKHFFNVENIIFVLGVHKEQLEVSIQSLYGEGLDVNGYLRRFIDIDYRLPSPDKGKFIAALFDKYGFSEYFLQKGENDLAHEQKQVLKMFEDLFEMYRLTLREQEHCCSLLSVAIRTTPHDQDLFPLFLCFLIVLKIKKSDFYNKFINEELSLHETLNHIRQLPGGSELLESNYGIALEAYLITCKSGQQDYKDAVNKYVQIDSDSYPRQEERARAYKMLETIKYIRRKEINVLSYLVRKIEIATRFRS